MEYESRRTEIRPSYARGNPTHGHRTSNRRGTAVRSDLRLWFQSHDTLQVDSGGLAPGRRGQTLRSRPTTGRPRSLTPRQGVSVLLGQWPRSASVQPGLWPVDTRCCGGTDQAKQMFDVTLGLTAIGELLAKHGLMPQKPLQRVHQRDRLAARNRPASQGIRS